MTYDCVGLTRSAPSWLPPEKHGSFRNGASIELMKDLFLLPGSNEAMQLVNAASGETHGTQLVFGSRNPYCRYLRFGSPDHMVPGVALLISSKTMLCYCAHTDQMIPVCSLGETKYDRATSLLTLPGTSTFVIGVGHDMFVYDRRSPTAIQTCASAPHKMWVSAAMATENMVVSWNSVQVDVRRGFSMLSHCQQWDVRNPSVWLDAPEWTIGDKFVPLWAAPVESRPLLPI